MSILPFPTLIICVVRLHIHCIYMKIRNIILLIFSYRIVKLCSCTLHSYTHTDTDVRVKEEQDLKL